MKKLILSVFAGLLVVCGAAELNTQTAQIPTLTSKAYASMKKDEVFVVLFSTSYCRPCAAAKKAVMPALAAQYAQDETVRVYIFVVDEDVPAADGTHLDKTLGIDRFPTFAVLYNGTIMWSRTGFSANQAETLKQQIAAEVTRLK